MKSRFVQFLLLAAAVLYIGVARTHLTAAPSLAIGGVSAGTVVTHGANLTKANAKTDAKNTEPAVTSSLDVNIVGDEVTFQLHVTNGGPKRVELLFPSGQTHDIVVYDAAGGEVWRWSVGQMFTQSLRNRALDVHETLSYAAHWRHPDLHGPVTAVATLTSTNFPSQSRAAFTLP
jgi:Intracellular proteinase inhibitor